MAIHAHSTPASGFQRRLLRAALGSNYFQFGNSCPTVEALAAGEEIGTQPCDLNGLGPKQALVRLAPAAALLPPEPEPDTTAQARALHMRRELRKGLDHGLALMDALDLSPRGLDLMDRAIAQLDALEAPDEDLEDDDPAEETSLETAGRGLVRCGADDAEEDDGCERGEEYGSEDGEDIGHHASRFTPRPLTRAERAEVAAIAARAATMRRASCLT